MMIIKGTKYGTVSNSEKWKNDEMFTMNLRNHLSVVMKMAVIKVGWNSKENVQYKCYSDLTYPATKTRTNSDCDDAEFEEFSAATMDKTHIMI